ncbi:9146_t:CDS:10 [Gigaspora margarita]|uniref:9146_t:CDS:1 n=1 Tax=Gigaspora margarita TaxID=4874 RepID=A0ABM8VZ01_GIGMA|nr:9146_t:CDS:10 [Gigaspora margarita]
MTSKKRNVEEYLNDFDKDKLRNLHLAIQKRLKKYPKVIIFAGAIGSGKTTLAKLYEKYLADKGLVVYRMKEVSLQIPEELEIFYETKNSLFFQTVIINKYKELFKEINEISGYDYIFIDRSPKEIEIFINVNHFDEKIKNYLKKEQNSITQIELDCKEIYVRPEKKTSIERKILRDRSWEKCDEDYLFLVYDEYERMISEIYPNHVLFDNSDSLCQNCRDLNIHLYEGEAYGKIFIIMCLEHMVIYSKYILVQKRTNEFVPPKKYSYQINEKINQYDDYDKSEYLECKQMVHIDKLPLEILVLIFQFAALNTTLSNNDFYQLKFVSKKWKDIYRHTFKIYRSNLFKMKYILTKRRNWFSHDPPERYPYQINEKIDQIKVDFGLGGKIIYKVKENIVSKEPIFDTFHLVSFEEYDNFDKSECINCGEMTYCCNYFEYNISDEMCEFDCLPNNIYNFVHIHRLYFSYDYGSDTIDIKLSSSNTYVFKGYFKSRRGTTISSTFSEKIDKFTYRIYMYGEDSVRISLFSVNCHLLSEGREPESVDYFICEFDTITQTFSNFNKEKVEMNVKIDYVFFDIKLKNLTENTIESYVEEFNSDSYKILNYQPFDSTEKYDFIRLYFTYREAFKTKYYNKISCAKDDFNIMILDSQEELILTFASLLRNYSPAFEIGFNTGGYDWNFILKKVQLLKINDAFNMNRFSHTKVNVIENVKERVVTRKELGDEKKIGNKMVISYVTRISDKHKITIEHGRFYYVITSKPNFKTISEKMYPVDYFVSYKKNNKKDEIFEANEMKKQHRITDFFEIEPSKKRKNQELNQQIDKPKVKQRRIEDFFSK